MRLKHLPPIACFCIITCSLVAQTNLNNAPTYQWAYAGNAVIPTPEVAPFNEGSPAGTIVSDSTLSANAHIVRLTDAQTGCVVAAGTSSGPGAFLSTPSGGDEDVITNTDETLVQARCSGGVSYVIAINPKTLQVGGHSGRLCPGSFTFSQRWNNVAFCRPSAGSRITVNGSAVTANGTSVYSLTFPHNSSFACGEPSCPDPTQTPKWVLAVDFANACAKVPKGHPTWSSILSVEKGDTLFNEAFSWAGGQDTGHLDFAFIPGRGCQTIDTLGDGTSAQWYPSKLASPQPLMNGATGLPVQASWTTIHDTTSNGTWVSIAKEQCSGPDCGKQGHGPALWKVGTDIVFMTSSLSQFSGHHSLGKSYFYDDTWPLVAHPFSNLAGANYMVGWYQVPGCPTCYDDHFQADRLDAANPILGATGGSGSEVYALPTILPATTSDGNPRLRFVKTYTSGIVKQNNFWAQYAIGAPGQRRGIFCWATDMLGQLGQYTDNTGTHNRSDEFCVGVAGQ